MDYLHHKSMPATLSNLEVFAIPPTQLAIDSSYEVSFRPSSTLDSAKTYDIQIPPSDDFTDLSETMIYVKLDIKDKDNKSVTDTDVINVVSGFSTTLFEKVDLYLNTVNISQSSGLYHYQAYLEDMLFRYSNKADQGAMWWEDEKNKARIKKPFDLYFRLHNPLCAQRNLLLNNIPILMRFSRNPSEFGLIGTNKQKFTVKVLDIAVHVKRVKVFPDVSLGIQEGLEKSPVNYFITRNEVKSFVIPTSITTANFENVFTGILPRRMVVGFVSAKSFSGTESPFKFQNFSINAISTQINGVQYPSIAYTPDFNNDLYMREFVNLYRYTNQYDRIPMLKLAHDSFKDGNSLFAFDYSPDSTLGSESGTLSLIKRGNIKLEIRFEKALTEPIHVIIFGQYDNMIQIDKYRNVNIDW